MRPKFDHNEDYYIAYYRQYRKAQGARIVAQDVTTVVVSATFFALGFFKSDITWSIIGFGIVVYLALRNLVVGERGNRVIASIIEKYEAACQEYNRPSHTEQTGNGQSSPLAEPESEGGDKPQPESEGRSQ